MYKIVAIALVLMSIDAQAQNKNTLDSIDNVIITKIIAPAEKNAGTQDPNWTGISEQVRASYNDVQTDRAVTKAEIYYYWIKDWPKFSTAIVHYTEVYEDKDDLALMNKNATYVLRFSQDPKEWKVALGWMQHAVSKEPDNTTYKATCDELKAKVGVQ